MGLKRQDAKYAKVRIFKDPDPALFGVLASWRLTFPIKDSLGLRGFSLPTFAVARLDRLLASSARGEMGLKCFGSEGFLGATLPAFAESVAQP